MKSTTMTPRFCRPVFRHVRRRHREAHGRLQRAGRYGLRAHIEAARGGKVHAAPVPDGRRGRDARERDPQQRAVQCGHGRARQQALLVATRPLVQRECTR